MRNLYVFNYKNFYQMQNLIRFTNKRKNLNSQVEKHWEHFSPTFFFKC